MLIYGASGHAKVIIDIINSTGKESINFVLDDDPDLSEILGYEVWHHFEKFMLSEKMILAIGNNRTRFILSKKIENRFCEPLIHKTAVVSESSKIKNGTVVMPNAVINASSHIGKHCIINTGAVVEHDVEIGDFVHISPSASITGNVTIEEGTQVGAGAAIIPGIKIGKWVTIGAGAVVIEDIPDFAVVVGNPAKIIKYNTIKDE